MMVDVGDSSLKNALEKAKAGIAERKRHNTGAAKASKHKPKRKAKSSKRGRSNDDLSAADRVMVDQVVSAEAQAHGHYRPIDFKLQEVTEGGKRKEKTIRVVRNLGGTPVERWQVRGHLDERQMAAILFYQAAYRTWIGEPRVTANYSPAIVRNVKGSIELYAASVIAAKESLRLLDQEVFFRLPVGHFQVWQNVVIFDEPAGVAGGRAGFLHKQAEGAARAIVSIVASMIADIVIDSSRKDFGSLLLDLDAPRRPGRSKAA
jgi:hypothetical protein